MANVVKKTGATTYVIELDEMEASLLRVGAYLVYMNPNEYVADLMTKSLPLRGRTYRAVDRLTTLIENLPSVKDAIYEPVGEA